MNDKKVLRYGLKYLNLAFGILMLVVASLNIEQITHNKRIFNSNLLVNNETQDTIENCRACQSRALSAITTLNIEGLFLSLVLAMYSFILAYKQDLLIKHCRYLVPCCFLTMILTAVYFVLCFISKLPQQCVQFDSEVKSNKWLIWECNADFDYNLENKVIPLSVLMLVLIPQLLVRSVVIVFSYCMNRDFKTLKCNDWMDFDSTTLSSHNDNVSYLNTSMTAENETRGVKSSRDSKDSEERMELLDRPNMCESETVVLGIREMPVDCPTSQSPPHVDLTYSHTDPDMFEINKNTLIERIKSELSLISPTHRFEMYTQNNNSVVVATPARNKRPANNLGGYGYSMRNSSLSTISEEQTLADSTNVSVMNFDQSVGVFDELDDAEFEQNRPTTPDDWIEIRDALKDFEYKTVMLNEILQVFVPSSRDGTFCRNVPIRLSSPFKSRQHSNLAASHEDDQIEMEEAFEAAKAAEQALSHTMNILEKHFQPNFSLSSLSKISRDNNNNSSGGGEIMNAADLNLMVSRKMRFVKRLKNRIETRRGRPLSELTSIADSHELNMSDQNNNNLAGINETINQPVVKYAAIKPVFF